MKRIFMWAAVTAFIIVLSACGQQLSKEEIVNQAASKDFNSFKAAVKMNMHIEANGQQLDQSMNFAMKYKKDPFLTQLTMHTIEGDLEMYFNQDYAYIMNPETDQWVKTSIADVEELEALTDPKAMEQDLERINQFTDVFEFERTEEGYKLHTAIDEASSEQQLSLVKDVLKDAMKENNEEGQFTIEKVNQFDYTVQLDKDLYLKKASVKMDVSVTVDGKPVKFDVQVDADYDKINQMESLSLPEEVKQNAKEL
ncbi:MAG TPA: DUF6612 family protein [Bacillales bacterium]|nr:DUF6612 family protein [Bacillales bacterium]